MGIIWTQAASLLSIRDRESISACTSFGHEQKTMQYPCVSGIISLSSFGYYSGTTFRCQAGVSGSWTPQNRLGYRSLKLKCSHDIENNRTCLLTHYSIPRYSVKSTNQIFYILNPDFAFKKSKNLTR